MKKVSEQTYKQLQKDYNTLGTMFSRCQTQLESLLQYQDKNDELDYVGRGGSNRFKTKTKKQNKRRRKTRRRRN